MTNRMNKDMPVFYAAISKEPMNVLDSSSGGVFYELCKSIIDKNGKVYGAVQINATMVEHRGAITLEEAKSFRKSKYLKSQTKRCYAEIREELESGRCILFSGVGCQIAGLYNFLKKDYENLLTCEVVCHGVPLSETMEKYCSEKEQVIGDKIIEINFRDKRKGWKNNCITEKYETGREETVFSVEHPVHSLYLKGINMEKACGSCKFQCLPRIADITLADFWKYSGPLQKIGEQTGISLIAVNSENGKQLLDNVKENLYLELTEKETVLKSCRHMTNSPYLHPSQKAFYHIIKDYAFSMIYDLFSSFEEIVLADECKVLSKTDELQVIKIFQENTQEIVYIENQNHDLIGIVTFGEFIKKYAECEPWVNDNFKHVVFSADSANEIREIFDENKKINRIPVVDTHGKFLFEVRRNTGTNGVEDKRKMQIPFSMMRHNGNKCLFIKRPDLLTDFEYGESQLKRIRGAVSFSVMQEDIQKYSSDFQELYGEKFSEKYIEELCDIPPIIIRGRKYMHADQAGKYVNVVGGNRITVNQPADFSQAIHMYGRCGVFGYAVEDEETLPSNLQKQMNHHAIPVGVVNHGLWGADDKKIIDNLTEDFINGEICENDIVVIYMDFFPWIEELRKFGVEIFDTTGPFHDFLRRGGNFFDKPGHMTAEGYEFIAQYLFDILEKEDSFKTNKEYKTQKSRGRINCNSKQSKEVEKYLTRVKRMLPMEKVMRESVGAIVMNCNPFTNGHFYLIEEARKHVDILIIFVLEENKSFFTFEDRYQMVKLGTKNLDNVYVIPSGNYIISTITFPEYFLKEEQQYLKINAADDVAIFGEMIAPGLNIKKRFVGTEPTDMVTNQYNKQLKRILPEYGIDVVEIPRLKIGNDYVTATEVRKCIQNREMEGIRNRVPQSTFEYIGKRYLE
ncbi:MAG: Coenzyme F420 hydrogenase/dehydrogenase, beta subunit C-terminal domain [Lachnospiraceae bacterium]